MESFYIGLLIVVVIVVYLLKTNPNPRKEERVEIIGQHKPSLYQRIKAQPVAFRRFIIVLIITWVSAWSFSFFSEADFNIERKGTQLYLMITFIPILIPYAIYWIISGIKKDS